MFPNKSHSSLRKVQPNKEKFENSNTNISEIKKDKLPDILMNRQGKSIENREENKELLSSNCVFKNLISLDKRNVGSYSHFFTKKGTILNDVNWINSLRINEFKEKAKNHGFIQFSFYEKDISSWEASKLGKTNLDDSENKIKKLNKFAVLKPLDVEINGNTNEYSHIINKIHPQLSNRSQINFLYNLRKKNDEKIKEVEDKEKGFSFLPLKQSKTLLKISLPPTRKHYNLWLQEVYKTKEKTPVTINEASPFSGKFAIKNLNFVSPFFNPGHATWEAKWISNLRKNLN